MACACRRTYHYFPSKQAYFAATLEQAQAASDALAAHVRIQLTTVRSDAVEMGRRAAELVVSAAREGRHVAHREVQSNPLVIRATTGRPPQ